MHVANLSQGEHSKIFFLLSGLLSGGQPDPHKCKKLCLYVPFPLACSLMLQVSQALRPQKYHTPFAAPTVFPLRTLEIAAGRSSTTTRWRADSSSLVIQTPLSAVHAWLILEHLTEQRADAPCCCNGQRAPNPPEFAQPSLSRSNGGHTQ